jgi:long-chain acyl-CoA synthetase
MREKDTASGRPGPGRRWPRSARDCQRPGRAGLQARRQPAIIGDNRPRLYWVDGCRAVPGRRAGDDVPGRRGGPGDGSTCCRMRRSSFASSRTRSRSTSCSRSRVTCPLLEHVIYDDPRGMRHYNQTFLHGLDEVLEMGRIHNRTTRTSSTARSTRAAPTTSP